MGSALLGLLKEKGFNNILKKSHGELDLIDQGQTSYFFDNEKPEYVFLAAAKVGGIYSNLKFKAEFMYDNLIIQSFHILKMEGKKIITNGISEGNIRWRYEKESEVV